MFLPRLLASLAFFALSAHANTPEEWKAFLIQNAKKQGVITLPSGLQYSVINKGEGIYIPTEDSPCSFHYHGSHIDGRVFDSTVYRGTPATFSPNQVVKAWTEIMQMMVEGDKFELVIPAELGYGDKGNLPRIKGGETLITTLEMLEIQGNKIAIAQCNVATLDGCNEKEAEYIEKTTSRFGSDTTAMREEMERIGRITETVESSQLRQWGDRRVWIIMELAALAMGVEANEL
mmetsp:Transcript_20621/g.41266  ORF Transcript_20621/g.41266 Transcript_20621/m.41266 type:complete len:233 (-) Transcript_20621:230-928(-)|eukprot:CAMPEP_0194346974 /NCGR_PEP_ID=MMETSP0171-20130528/105731_1 /TAXON_ID=218684 /ORGANISM="Corethron pennatum, Strain L29A3" /LENGTH=232 /DNA_ID=CAMNT_0039114173 /DNA_START=577 /DNA_END=1275 /DNA_ORIENTATION=+